MYEGRTIVGLAEEVQRQSESKRDFVVDTRTLEFTPPNAEDHTANIHIKEIGDFGVGQIAHRQIGERLSIPAKYYDRCLIEAPGLLSLNVNFWFQNQPETRMIRTLDGRARAFLSDRYRQLDNMDLAEMVLPKLADAGCSVMSCDITDRNMYIKATTAEVQREVKQVGDIVQAGVQIRNSEVGLGSLAIDPLVVTLRCLNGMVANVGGLRKYHVGGRANGNAGGHEEDAFEFFRDETLRADDKAFFMKVGDAVEGVLREDVFGRLVDRLDDSTEVKINKDPVKAVEVTQRVFGLSDEERGSVLKHLIENRELSQYGLLNAITRTSQDAYDYDRASELEVAGFKVLELSKMDWNSIAN